jgi:predicted double-glycine peptidase
MKIKFPPSLISLIWAQTVLATPPGLPDRNDWKSQRDYQIEKQQKDYSCGAASLASLLKYHYGLDVNESTVLNLIPDLNNDLAASFTELSIAIQHFGFRSVGVQTDFVQLSKLKVPAIVHMEHQGQGHFSVIRGIDQNANRVWLSDPSWGNIVLTRHRFESMWVSNDSKGKLLLVLPDQDHRPENPVFFSPPQDTLGMAREFVRANFR